MKPCFKIDKPLVVLIFSNIIKLMHNAFCQAAVKKVMSTYPELNLVQSILSCLAALTNPDVDLSWAKFSSS